ncbi:hypothetical protein I302_102807 [Kwoniella bestiolae CBS 10118]|uniref:CMGC/CLK protein kinase n=1 Tax=Kwoniella bestiolae CBS 10118 TaxID=1296100 RepID=A0A1B9GGA7_9TREE|nr:CMGC/CLK protein kinase [Kwoniella bestiolae CBS 10118]OCF29985.1 CMGC/CLK protein kinase [Kwoniella bestiolae CBS 10118]
MSRHHQQHLSSPIYHQTQNHNPLNSTTTTTVPNTQPQFDNYDRSLLSPPHTASSSSAHTRESYYQDHPTAHIPSILPPRAPSLFQPPPPREDTGYRLESRGRIPAIRIPPVPYRKNSNTNSLSGIISESSRSPYEQPPPLLPPIQGSSSGGIGLIQDSTRYHSFGQPQPSPSALSHSHSHSHSRSPYPGHFYTNPLSASSSSASYSIERGLRSPHPPLTAGLLHQSQSHLWPHHTLPPPLGSSPHAHTHSRSPQDHLRRDSLGGSSNPIYYSADLPSVPGPSTSALPPPTQTYRASPSQLQYDSNTNTPYLPSTHSVSYSSGYNRQSSPVQIPPPLHFKYSASPPPHLPAQALLPGEYNLNTMPPRKKATGDTSTTTTPRTMSSATGIGGSGSVSRSGRKGVNGKGWTMEHTYDSVGQKKEIIVIDDSQSPMITQQPQTIRKRTRAQVAAEQAQAQAMEQAQHGIYNGHLNGNGSTTSLNSSTKKRKVDEGSEHGSAKKAKGKLASTATSASVQATGQSYAHQQYATQQKAQVQKTQAAPPAPPGQPSQPPWDDAEGHYIVKPDDVIGGRYKIVRLLGQGTFGKVVEARHIETRRKVAIKVIRAVQKYRDASKIEIRVLETLKKNDPRNENKCIHLDEYFDFRNHPCLVSELYGMSVFDFLKQNSFQPFPEKHIQDFARSLLRSVAFLHTLKLVHTDLKPENILLCSNESRLVGPRVKNSKAKSVLRNTEIRLIDFGSATFENEYHSSVVSTRHYRAPEIILGLPWSYPCDMFSIGCILVEFYTGDALFQTHDNLEHLAMMEVVMGKFSQRMIEKGRHKKPEFFRGPKIDFPNATVSKASRKYVKNMRSLKDIIAPTNKHQHQFLDLCLRLLDHDPDVRLKVQDALRHPYLREPIPEPA